MAKLAPCPKCGKNQKRTLPVKCYFEIRFKVKCTHCGFEIDDFESKEEAHEIWNSLKPPCRVESANCADIECAPPFGDKNDCEFHDNGKCKAIRKNYD